MESFRLPLYLREERPDLPEYPRPIFRDETDLELGFLSENIHRALDLSHYLIVICSPRVIKSKYVQDEIQYFRKYGTERIIPFIIDGVPFSENPDLECFPDEIKKIPGILAANINELGRDYAAIKIIARMLDLKVDELWQRYNIAEEKEKQRLKEERNNLLRIQSYYLAEKSITLYHEGKYDLARKLALYALPQDKEFNDRPYVSEADEAFRLSYASFKYIFNGNNGCISPNGKWVAVISHNSAITLYHTESGDVVHEFAVCGYCLSISFSCDSKSIACGTRNGTIYMWNIATGTLIGKLEVGFAIISITFNPDMNHLMASLKKYDYQKAKIANLDNRNNSIITISLKSFDIEQEWKLDKYGEAPQIEFSHTGKYIMSYTHNQASIRMVETGKILHTEHNVRHISFSDDDRYYIYGFGHCMPFVDAIDSKHTRIYKHYNVSFAAFCGSTNNIMAICDDGSIRIWKQSIGDGKLELFSILRGHSQPIKWAAATKDGDIVATCSEDNTIKVWSVRKSQCIASTHCEHPEKIDFLENDHLLAITTKQNIRLWEYLKDKPILKLEGHREGIVSLNYSHENFSLLTGSSDAELLLWDLTNGTSQKIGKLEESSHCFTSAILSKNCKYIALLYQEVFTLWNIEDKKCVCNYQLKESFISGTLLLDRKNNGFIITAGDQVLYSDTNGNIHEIISTNSIFNNDDYEWKDISCTAIDSKSGLLACGIELGPISDSYPICLFDRTGKIHCIMSGHTQTITLIGIDTENSVMISATEYGEIKWWNTDNGICEKTIYINGRMLSLCLYNGELRLAYEKDGNIILDDCTTHHTLCSSSDVNIVTLSPDGSLVFIGCGWTSSLYDAEGCLVNDRTDCYAQVIIDKPLHKMIRYVKDQCKNLNFTDEEKQTYHL